VSFCRPLRTRVPALNHEPYTLNQTPRALLYSTASLSLVLSLFLSTFLQSLSQSLALSSSTALRSLLLGVPALQTFHREPQTFPPSVTATIGSFPEKESARERESERARERERERERAREVN